MAAHLVENGMQAAVMNTLISMTAAMGERDAQGNISR